MKLYVSPRAPNPRRVQMFIAEKGLEGIEEEVVEIGRDEHKSPAYLEKSPFAKLPVLELDDGRVLGETRAICTFLEGVQPEPNLMGRDFEERAFIEMADRRAELYLFGTIANCIRHTHPGLAPLEQPQFADFGRSQGEKMRDVARWFDAELGRQPYVAGERFTIADITAFCALEFARGLMRFRPGQEGMPRLQAWRDRLAERPSAQR
ncbi:MAG: glutathione S-transferase family protein [Thauera phenolivorans]|uniref:Glutathione S-transferase family protein n=2 Tax=Thauera phenolivorans TaxID=1792543 RepID=A0A7X7R8X5_9RHOO|nr:glutathione S-transferase family protein [Thauera phenolivorans]